MLINELMERKIAKVDFEDLRDWELKEFMNLWNKVTLKTDVSSLNDRIRIKEYMEKFQPEYADTTNKELKTSTVNRK